MTSPSFTSKSYVRDAKENLRVKWNNAFTYFHCNFQSVVFAAGGIYFKPLAESFAAAVKQVLKDKPKDQIKIIDVAAGTGLVGVELQKLGYANLHALDISQKMLNEAKKKKVYKKFICAALNDKRIPEIETGEFDALVCGGTMLTGHIRSSALMEMTRIVKIGKFHSYSPVIFVKQFCRKQRKTKRLVAMIPRGWHSLIGAKYVCLAP